MKKSFCLEDILEDYSSIKKSDRILDGDIIIDNAMITIMYNLFEREGIDPKDGLHELKISLDSPSKISKFFNLIPQKILKRLFLDFFGAGITIDSGPEFQKIKYEADKSLPSIKNPLEYLNKLADFVMNYTLDYSSSRVFVFSNADDMNGIKFDHGVKSLYYNKKLYLLLKDKIGQNFDAPIEVEVPENIQRSMDILKYFGYVTPLNKILKDKKSDCLINSIIGYKLTALYRNDVDIRIAFGFYSDDSAQESSSSLNLDPFFRLPLLTTSHAWLEAELDGHKYIIDPGLSPSAINADPPYPKEYKRLGELLVLRRNKNKEVKRRIYIGTSIKPIYS